MNNSPRAVLLFNDTRSDHHFGCDAVMEALTRLLEQNLASNPLHFYSLTLSAVDKNRRPLWAKAPDISKHLAESCLLVVNGEGTIHHSNKRAQGLTALAPLARRIHLPSVLLNATVYENDRIVHENMRQFALVYVRDTASQKRLVADGIDAKFAPDLTFFHDFENVKKRSNGRVCVSDSIIKRVHKRLDAYRARFQWEKCNIVYPVNNKSHRGDYCSYVEYIKGFDLVVTGRYHDVCFCINAKIPFVAVESNTNKISSLLEDVFGNRRRMITTSQLFKLKINQFAYFTEEELALIDKFKRFASQQFESLQEDISRLAEQSVDFKDESAVQEQMVEVVQKGVRPPAAGFRCYMQIKKFFKKFF